jgi:hypothetical protein
MTGTADGGAADEGVLGRIDDPYERQALRNLQDRLHRPPSRVAKATGRVAERVGKTTSRATELLPDAATASSERALRTALGGLRAITLDPALKSVRTGRVLEDFRRDGHQVRALDDVRSLPLRDIDDVCPRLTWIYSVGAALEGAGAGVAITGGELLASVGSVAGAGAGAAPGAGTVITAMAVDAATVVGASARVVAHIGAYHGYDVRRPDEAIFALSVINWSSAGTEGAKAAAFTQLSRITQQLVRRATWPTLERYVLVQAVQELFTRLGLRLTQRKLGQVIPVVGIVIGGGMNAALLSKIGHDAEAAYRMRYLCEKYGIDPRDLRVQSEPISDRAVGAGSRDAIDVEAILDEAAGDAAWPDVADVPDDSDDR